MASRFGLGVSIPQSDDLMIGCIDQRLALFGRQDWIVPQHQCLNVANNRSDFVMAGVVLPSFSIAVAIFIMCSRLFA